MMELTKELATAALYGGLFLGGGGGGHLKGGLETLEAALSLGTIHMLDLDEFDSDGLVITASAVGSPASKEGYLSTDQVLAAFELIQSRLDAPVKGIITNENGGHSTSNGWILSASTGLPFIDAPCNGRAHPTGVMGSMGMDLLPDYRSLQAAAGGRGRKALEVTASGDMNSCAGIIRQAAVSAGGLVSVYRNPVKASYLSDHAAPGGIAQAVRVGELFMKSRDKEELYRSLTELLDMEVLVSGKVSEFSLTIEGGFDHGYLCISDGKDTWKTTFWNEFMSVDVNGKRISTFPDLIACLDSGSGRVVTSAEMSRDRNIDVVRVPMEKLILGAGMRNRGQFELVETVLGISMIPYLDKGFLQ